MMIVKVFSDFCSSEKCKENFEDSCKTFLLDNYGIDKEIYITADDNYSHAIILNKAMPDLSIEKNNVLGLACEPPLFLNLTPEFIEYAKKHIGKYFIGNLPNNLGNPFIEHHGFMWFDHPLRYKIIKKTKLMSIVFSQKNFAPGHVYRKYLVNNIINNNLPIDIYGRGCNLLPENIKKCRGVKGEFDKTEPYDDYVFTICIENFSCNQYFSEKIITPIMCETIPLYFGCKNIKQHVGNYLVSLNGVLKDDMELIVDVLKNPNKYIQNVTTSKGEIFDRVNLIKNFKTLF
jgi:hypothetical protein